MDAILLIPQVLIPHLDSIIPLNEQEQSELQNPRTTNHELP